MVYYPNLKTMDWEIMINNVVSRVSPTNNKRHRETQRESSGSVGSRAINSSKNSSNDFAWTKPETEYQIKCFL